MNQQPSQLTSDGPMEKRPMTREQRRFQERVTKEANQVFDRLKDSFIEFFVTNSNPESEEVKDKIKTLSAQWKVYCRSKHLIPSVFTVMDQFCNDTIKQYQEDKAQMRQELDSLKDNAD